MPAVKLLHQDRKTTPSLSTSWGIRFRPKGYDLVHIAKILGHKSPPPSDWSRVIRPGWQTLLPGRSDAPESEKPPQGRPLHSLRRGALSGNAFQRFETDFTTGYLKGQNCSLIQQPLKS